MSPNTLYHVATVLLTPPDTVISIQETPVFLEIPKGIKVNQAKLQQEELQSMRKNTRALLSQLSTIGIREYLVRISSQKGVRSDLKPRAERGSVPSGRTTVKESEADVDGSANLFYYLFEDYSAGISILKDSSMTLSRLVRTNATSLLLEPTTNRQSRRLTKCFKSLWVFTVHASQRCR